MERKLASVQIIKEIKSIEGADAIELAVVNGWQCVAKKDEFKENDYCVYFEIDSYLPIEPIFEFLRKSSYKAIKNPDGSIMEEGFRLKTMKMIGQISQGLVIPLILVGHKLPNDTQLGDDVTESLNVTKYDPPVPAQLAGLVKGNFPSFINKTEQERIQNIFDELKETDNDTEWEVSIKLDGTSCTYFTVDPNEYSVRDDNPREQYFGHCSRNLETKDTGTTPWLVAESFRDKMMNGDFRNFAVQGELMGPGIQKNQEKLKNPEFFCFDIFNIETQGYVSSEIRDYICEELGIKQVHVLDRKYKLSEFNTIEDLLEFADGPSMNLDTKREGLVFKSVDGTKSFKVISNKWLLKN